MKAVYRYGLAQDPPAAARAKKLRNDFQNLELAIARFAELGLDPFDGLGARDFAILELNIQKRHVIGHNLGVVDDRFAQVAQDAKLGETVLLVGEEIRTFAILAQSVVDRLDSWMGGFASPFIGKA